MRNIDKSDPMYNTYIQMILNYIFSGGTTRVNVIILNRDPNVEFLFDDTETDDILRIEMSIDEYGKLLQSHLTRRI